MNCGHCDWYESEVESGMNGYCSFTAQTLLLNDVSGTEEPACRKKTFAEWEREQGMKSDTRQGMKPGLKPDMGQGMKPGFRTGNRSVEGEDWREHTAAAVAAVPAGRPASMMPSSEWRLGYLKRLRDKPSSGMGERLATI